MKIQSSSGIYGRKHKAGVTSYVGKMVLQAEDDEEAKSLAKLHNILFRTDFDIAKILAQFPEYSKAEA